ALNEESTRADIERRAWVRYSCDLNSSCQPLAATTKLSWTAKVHDISCGGIALLLERRFQRGTLLSVQLLGTDGDASDTLMAQVVRVQALPNRTWLLGCRFNHPLAEKDLEQLL